MDELDENVLTEEFDNNTVIMQEDGSGIVQALQGQAEQVRKNILVLNAVLEAIDILDSKGGLVAMVPSAISTKFNKVFK